MPRAPANVSGHTEPARLLFPQTLWPEVAEITL